MTVDLTELMQMVGQGYVRRVEHPHGGVLELFNYTEKCSYEGAWNPTTRQCRGLILNRKGEVVARPFPKFFNYGEPNAPQLDLDAPAVVTDKLDGSLGILYPDPTGGYAIATRGSFTSDQAIHATMIWKDRYEPDWQPGPQVTYLFEIIYPTNRIVVDYKGLDDIILLGVIGNQDGDFYGPECFSDWPGHAAQVFEYPTLRAAMEAEARPGQEGLVVWFPSTRDRVKIKQDDYVQIHRLVFGLTKRKLWERLGIEMLWAVDDVKDVKTIARVLYMDPADVEAILPTILTWMDDMLQIIPEEFADWVHATTAELGADIIFWVDAVQDTFDGIARKLKSYEQVVSRGEWAEEFKIAGDPGFTAALFALLDDKSITSYALRAVQPSHETFKPIEEAE